MGNRYGCCIVISGRKNRGQVCLGCREILDGNDRVVAALDRLETLSGGAT